MPLAGAAQQSLAASAGLQQQQQQLVFVAGDGNKKVDHLWDPSSVLDHRPTSTLSSPLSDVFAGANSGAWLPGDDGGKEDSWVHHLPHPLDMPTCSWEPPPPQQQQQQHQGQADSPFLRWIMAGDDTTIMEDPQGFAADRQFDTKLPAWNPRKVEDTNAAVEQLAEAARLAETGNVLGAREILARLNWRTAATPLHRSALYFSEALLAALSSSSSSSMSSSSSPVDVVLKLGAYKAFSEVSPVIQFAHFTCVQAVLDQLGGAAACIHVLDFDIGVGEQWASLMRELPPGAALKVTALVSSSSSTQHHHSSNPLELQLVHENLCNFAAETGVAFQFAVFNLDATEELMASIAAAAGGEAIAVHLPVGGDAPAALLLHHLLLLRRLVVGTNNNKLVVVTVDRGGCYDDMFQALRWCVCLLESLDAVGAAPDVSAKIERFLIQPRIHACVLNKFRAATATAAAVPSWRSMLASAGFVPVQASSLAEVQAESLLKNVRGFRVEKRAGSLALHWQRGELVSVTAWKRC